MRKKILALVLAMVMVIAMLPTVAFAVDFADTKGHWAEAQIDRWSDFGVVGGDGTGFNPNGNMTRAEAAKTFASLLKLSKKADLTTYTDVPTAEWKVDALAMAVAKGIINGMSATTLVPDGTLTREQMFVMIGRALGIKPADTSTKTFVDGKETSSWATGYINALVNMGAVKGVGNDQLKPTDVINRASVMSALDQLIGGYANTDGQTVEIVPGKITLVVADDVKVTGTADPTVPIVIAGTAKTVDLEGVTVTGDAAPVVQVQVADVAVENAPVGTSVTAAEDATGVTANGTAVAPNADVTIPSTSTTPPTQSYIPPVPQTVTHTVTIQANNKDVATITTNPTATSGKVTVEDGKDVAITISSIAKGYKLGSVKSGDTVVKPESDGTYIIKNVTADITVTITFVKAPTIVDGNGNSFTWDPEEKEWFDDKEEKYVDPSEVFGGDPSERTDRPEIVDGDKTYTWDPDEKEWVDEKEQQYTDEALQGILTGGENDDTYESID